jgi:uncharacterized YigZ family protein
MTISSVTGGSMLEPVESASAELEIRKSRFIAIAERAGSAEEVRVLIKECRSAHPGASHVVHAFVSSGGDIFGMSDDREPKGTAGRPVLEVLKGSGIDNILVMVVRYFGGTKLGTGGLVKAYTGAAQAVLKVLKTRPLIKSCSIRLEISYDLYDQIRKELGRVLISPPQEDFGAMVSIAGHIPEEEFGNTAEAVREISSGRFELKSVSP